MAYSAMSSLSSKFLYPRPPLPRLNLSKAFLSTGSGDESDNAGSNAGLEIDDNDFLPGKPELQLQGVDPSKGWLYRGVHRAIICGKVGRAPVQKNLSNGKTITTFTVGTGGMLDQRLLGASDLPRPAQWHQIAVHNRVLGSYAVRHSSVYLEGDIETRIYTDSLNGEVKSIPEICVRRDGKLRLIKPGESTSSKIS